MGSDQTTRTKARHDSDNPAIRPRPARIVPFAIAAAILGGAGAWGTAAHGSVDDGRRTISVPLAPAGLVRGEGIRTTISNYGARPVGVRVVFVDQEGRVVRQEPATIEPGQFRTVDMSRATVATAESSLLLRTEVVMRRMDADVLMITSELIDWATGRTRLVIDRTGGCTGPSFACGSNANHDETLVVASVVQPGGWR
jgi:hypothetical protein